MPLVTKNFSDIITFTRASGATWFNSAGNLIGVDFSTSSNTIGTGSKTFTLNATAGVDRSWATGDTVLIVDQANSANNMTGAVTSYTASTQALVVNVTSTAGSGTITSWRVGNLMQRLDYNPSTLAAQGLLIEEARTNLALYSAKLDQFSAPAVWALTGVGATLTATTDIAAPDGTMTAWTLTSSGAAAQIQQSTTVVTSTTYTGSLWIRRRSGTGTVNIRVVENVNTPLAGVTSQWQRFNFTATSTSTTGRLGVFLSGTSDAVDIWGAQLEAGAFPTSYIPTTTTALTRNADQASVNTLSPWYNTTSGTLYAEVQHYAPSAAVQQWQAQLASGSGDYYGIYKESSPANITTRVRSGGADQAFAYTTGAISANTTYKTALGYAVNDVASCTNGGTVFTDNTVTLPTSITALGLGQPTYTTAVMLNGWIRRVSYFPRRLANAELQSLTA